MFVYWAMVLSIFGMYSVYIIQAGFSKMEIGIAVTIFTFSAFLGQNLMGYLADRLKCVKKIIFSSICISIIATAALIFLKQSRYTFLLIFLWGVFVYGTVPLSEAWYIGVLKVNGDKSKFGSIRGFGSLGYALSGILLGFLLQNFGWSIYKWYIFICACFVLLVILMMSESNEAAFYNGNGGRSGNCGDISFKEALGELVRNKSLRFVLIILFMYFFVVKGIYSYLGVLVSDFGGGPLSLGFTYFFDACPELVTFFLTTRLLNKFHSKSLIFAALILQILRLSLIIAFSSPLAIMLMGILSGFAYGLLAAAYKTYVYDLAPEKYKISCLSLCESIIGLSGVASVPVFGFVVMKFGGPASIALGLVIDVTAVLIMTGSMLRSRKSIGTTKNIEA